MKHRLRPWWPIVVCATLGACSDEPTPVTAPPAGSQPAAPATATERIVYSSLRPGNWDIFYVASAGAAPRRLTDHPGLDYDAALSPDGRWVVFTSERRGNPDLYALELEGSGEPRLLIDSSAMEDQVAFSPDGSSIAFVSTASGNADIYVLPFTPQTSQDLATATNVTNDPGGDFRPDFSPDGARIAFTTDRDTPVSGHPIFAFTRQREGDVYVMDRDGGNLQRLTATPDWDGSPEWSADGRTLYFYSARPREIVGPPTSPILGQEGGFRIWAMNADGSNPRAVTPEGVEALAPAVMADGRIAYQKRTGFARWSIESVAADGSGARAEGDTATDYWLPDFHAASGAMVVHGVGPAVGETQAVEEILGAGALLAADYPADVAIAGPHRHAISDAAHDGLGAAPGSQRNRGHDRERGRHAARARGFRRRESTRAVRRAERRHRQRHAEPLVRHQVVRQRRMDHVHARVLLRPRHGRGRHLGHARRRLRAAQPERRNERQRGRRGVLAGRRAARVSQRA